MNFTKGDWVYAESPFLKQISFIKNKGF